MSARKINDDLVYKRMYILASSRLQELTNELILNDGSMELVQLGHTAIINSFIKVNRSKYSNVRLNNGITERLNRRIANVIRSNMRFTNKERAIKIIILKINKQDIINQILKHNSKIIIK